MYKESTMNNSFRTSMVYITYVYLMLWLSDTIDYYYAYLILSLPSYMFGAPLIRITQPRGLLDSSSEEEDALDTPVEPTTYDVFISRLILVFNSNDTPPTQTHRVLNGAQLKPLIDSRGRFFIGHIHRYYPTLDTILLKYIKFPTPNSKMPILSSTKQDQTVDRVIDVNKRYDIRNSVSCRLGVNL